jgi:hypothetical protein
MKGVGKGQEALTEVKEENPCDGNTKDAVRDIQEPTESKSFEVGRPELLSQAVGAQDPILVLGNAFPAEVLPALGATGNSLAKLMIGTPLVNKVLHRLA